jgi:hypothetical protein
MSSLCSTRWRSLRRAGAIAAIVLLGVTAMVTAGLAPGTHAATARSVPKIGHIFVITLENKGYAETFGTPSADPYLASTLAGEGALLTQY